MALNWKINLNRIIMSQAKQAPVTSKSLTANLDFRGGN